MQYLITLIIMVTSANIKEGSVIVTTKSTIIDSNRISKNILKVFYN